MFADLHEQGGDEAQGSWVDQNASKAVVWLRRAINLGVVSNGGFAEYKLALCYFGGNGVPQSDAAGLQWSKAAKAQGCDQDTVDALNALGALKGDDWTRAIKFVRKPAVEGDTRWQNDLALMYAVRVYGDSRAQHSHEIAEKVRF